MNKRLAQKLLLLTCLFTTASTWSMDTKPVIHGFISQAWVHSHDNPLYDEDTGNHFNLRELGLTGSWELSDTLRVAGGLLYRDAGTFSEKKTRLDFLLLDYNFWLSETARAGLRAGRLKIEYGIYNSVRDVPHARPGVFVPQSIYFESFRDALLSVDGLGLYWRHDNDYGEFLIDLWGGTGQIDNLTVEYQITQANIEGEFNDVDELGGRMQWNPAAVEGLSVGATLMEISMELEDAPVFSTQQILSAAPILTADPTAYINYITHLEVDALIKLLSSQFARDNWALTAEYLNIDVNVDLNVLGFEAPQNDATLEAYYAQLEWFLSSQISLFGRYEELYYNKDNRNGESFAERTGGNPYTQYTKAYTAGLRWFFTTDISLTAEYSRNEGVAFINGQKDVDFADLKEDWDALILQFSYHF